MKAKLINENLNELHSIYHGKNLDNNYKLFKLSQTEDGKYGYENIIGIVRARNVEEAWDYIKNTFGFRDSERGFYPLDEISEERYDSLLNKAKSDYNKIANIINSDKRK